MSDSEKTVTTNRQARREYHIQSTAEAGLVLTGTEVKSLRAGQAHLQDAFCGVTKEGEMYLNQCHIAPYAFGNRDNHDPTRPRKLLLRRQEIHKFARAVQQKGLTIIPLRIYFRRGLAKVEIGLAKGKKLYDKRADLSERESSRRLQRIKRSGADQ